MSIVPAHLEFRHGVAVYADDVLERDAPWDSPGIYTLEDWRELPEDLRCELFEGHLVMSPAPAFEHQYLSALLHRILLEIALRHDADAIAAPFDVVLTDRLVMQPDLIYISSSNRPAIRRNAIHGAPDSIVEIESPGSTKRDREVKFEIYESSGVPEYWLFDPKRRTATFYVLNNGRFQARPSNAGLYVSPKLPELALDVDRLWRDFARRFPE